MSAVASTSTRSAKRIKVAKVGKASSTAPPLGKFLASSEKPVRDKAVASLSRFLAGSKKVESAAAGEEGESVELDVGEVDWDKSWTPDSRLGKGEMAKLWKGVFYCFWMSDKPLVQQALANDLALLTLDVRSKADTGRVARFRSALCYLEGFWATLVREWAGLDRLRLDKFYLLIRRFVHVAFLLLKREQWDPVAIQEYNAILTGPGGPLHVLDSKIPHSIAYHLSDIYLDELTSALSTPLRTFPPSSSPAPPVPLIALLEPFLLTLALSPNVTLFTRVSDHVLTPLFDAFLPPKAEPQRKRRKVVSEVVRPEYEVIRAGMGETSKEEAGKRVLEALFAEGGKKETNETNRRRIYALVREREGDESL